MSNRRNPTAAEQCGMSLSETFDRVHDGATIVDPDKALLAVFVAPNGEVHMRSNAAPSEFCRILRRIADMVEARG